MIIESHISFVRLLRVMWHRLIFLFLVALTTVLASYGLKEYEHWAAGIDLSVPLVLGTALSIFLGFRTNSGYERWWEARKLWGAIINDTRSACRLFKDFLGAQGEPDADGNRERIDSFFLRQAAWSQVLAQQLRGLPPMQGTDHLLSAEEKAAIGASKNPAMAVLFAQGAAVREASMAGQLDVRQAVYIEETISHLTDHQGGCERIKKTVFPAHYTFFTKIFIWVFLVLLGLSLPGQGGVGLFSIPAVFLIGWVFFLVDGIGDYMQDPFENNRNSTPMLTIARMLEIDVRELKGDKDLPDPIAPVDGAAW